MDNQLSPVAAIADTRARRINFRKIQELRDGCSEEDFARLRKLVQVFYKSDARSINEPWISFPAEYLAIASDTYRSAIWDDNAKSITIVGGEKAIYQQIFDWILDSVHQERVGPAPWPFYDDSTPLVFLRYAHLISTATELGIPAHDFADPIIKKRLFKLSRERSMSWHEVDFYLDNFAGDSDTDKKMREVLTNSIANAWWKRQLRENTKDADQDDYCILSVLRAEHSQLDEDLHKWCAKNEGRIRAKWAERAAARNAGRAGNSSGNSPGSAKAGSEGFGNYDIGRIAGTTAPSARDEAGDGTGKENMTPADSGYDSAAGAAPSIEALGAGGDWDDSGAGGDWGDEVNAYEQRLNTKW